jgi:hypothetical protein
MPLGSVTADHEIVKGAVTLAPVVGERGLGVGGVAAVATCGRVKKEHNIRKMKATAGERRFSMDVLSPCVVIYVRGRRIIGTE